jgi:hypothetical protein
LFLSFLPPERLAAYSYPIPVVCKPKPKLDPCLRTQPIHVRVKIERKIYVVKKHGAHAVIPTAIVNNKANYVRAPRLSK